MFKIGSIFIPVTNVEKATEWYEKYLEVKIIDRWEEGAGFYLPSGSTQLALIKVDSPQPTEFTTVGNKKNSYYNFVVDNIESVHQQFKENGIVTTEINHFGEMKAFDFFDLDGNPFSVTNEVANSPYHSDTIRKMQEQDLKKK